MNTDKVHKHMTDIKSYVDNSTKLIIDEIRLSRGEQIPEEQPEVYIYIYMYTLCMNIV